MKDSAPSGANDDLGASLKGTTYRVYRYMLKQRDPLGVSQIQKALGLSSPSVSEYHLRKLVRLGLVREEQGGFVVDKVVYDNIIRIRRVSIPFQAAYAAFFGVTLLILVFALRPETLNSLYFFALVVNVFAFGISVFEAVRTARRL